jgi:beta-fructofuranosidase
MCMNKFFIVWLTLTCFASQTSKAQNILAYWPLDELSGLTTSEVTRSETFTVNNAFPNTIREYKPGVKSKSLRCNGYATWVEGSSAIPYPTNGLTVSAWVAAEVLPFHNTAIFTNAALDGGCYLGLDKFGRPIGGLIAGNSTFHKVGDKPIDLYDWSLLTLTVDASTKTFKGYLNGILSFEYIWTSGDITWPALSKVMIGRHQTNATNGAYQTNLFCGLIDEVKIIDKALNQTEIANIYLSEKPITAPDMSIPATRFAGDIHRPIYHAIPPANWMNEPHGLLYFNGVYHNFYQKNGNGPYWGRLHWGHQTSPDLVVWTEQKPVLVPWADAYDREGCWSGTAFVANGKLYIMYTGVDGATAQICLAEGNQDATVFTKYAGNPLIEAPPAPYTGNDFRDPFIWQANGAFYMVIGSGNSGGGVGLLYKSTDFKQWQYLYPLHRGVLAQDNAGVFWELPIMLQYDQKDVFVALPTPYNGLPARTLYWTGSFQNDYFTPDQVIPKQLEPADALIGVTTFRDTLGRQIAMGVVPDILPGAEQKKNGWANTMSIPREWYLSADKTNLWQKPIPELEKLRGSLQHFAQVSVPDGQNNHLPNVASRYAEIRAIITPQTATKVGITLLKSANGIEQTRIYYDTENKILVVDRNNSSTNNAINKTFVTTPYIAPAGQPIDFHVFLDGSVLEVFINHEKAISTRVYPEATNSTGMDLYASGGTALFSTVDIWDMKAMDDPTLGFLEPQKVEYQNAIQRIYPNPNQGACAVELTLPKPGTLSIEILDTTGKMVHVSEMGQYPVGSHTLSLTALTQRGNHLFIKVKLDGQLIGSQQFITN